MKVKIKCYVKFPNIQAFHLLICFGHYPASCYVLIKIRIFLLGRIKQY